MLEPLWTWTREGTMADENVKIDTPPLANMWGESLLRAAWIYLQNDPICGLPLSEA